VPIQKIAQIVIAVLKRMEDVSNFLKKFLKKLFR